MLFIVPLINGFVIIGEETKMKRLITLILTLLFCMTGCHVTPSKDNPAQASNAPTTQKREPNGKQIILQNKEDSDAMLEQLRVDISSPSTHSKKQQSIVETEQLPAIAIIEENMLYQSKQ